MSAPPTRRNDWLTPQNMIAVLGLGLGVIGSARSFQAEGAASEKRLAMLESRVERLEEVRKDQEDRLKAVERVQVDATLRVDRLEHRQN